MTEPLPHPEAPPPEPPLDLWSSLAVLAVGAALLAIVVVKMLRNAEATSDQTSESRDDGSKRRKEGPDRRPADSTELSDGETV